jgi:hypothetical protein
MPKIQGAENKNGFILRMPTWQTWHAHAQAKPIPVFITPYQGYKRRFVV